MGEFWLPCGSNSAQICYPILLFLFQSQGEHTCNHIFCTKQAAIQPHEANCLCCSPAFAQSLDELAFERSAASAAQRGDLRKVQDLIERKPSLLHDDGQGGA
jgi:hypothetical protein